MVKTLMGIFISLSLLIGITIFENHYVSRQFDEFYAELSALYQKTEIESATNEDAEAVRISWNERKKSLHVWIPHNDISYVDYWLSESLGALQTNDFDEALHKLEVLKEICRNIPSAYSLSPENIF